MVADYFPFRMAWDLNTKDLMFYITVDQVMKHRWQIEMDRNLYNNPTDEQYVRANIIKHDEFIENLQPATQMESGNYCFVSMTKVLKYMVHKL